MASEGGEMLGGGEVALLAADFLHSTSLKIW